MAAPLPQEREGERQPDDPRDDRPVERPISPQPICALDREQRQDDEQKGEELDTENGEERLGAPEPKVLEPAQNRQGRFPDHAERRVPALRIAHLRLFELWRRGVETLCDERLVRSLTGPHGGQPALTKLSSTFLRPALWKRVRH